MFILKTGPGMVKKIVLLSFIIIFLLNCEPVKNEKSFDLLTDDEKRLSENALSGMTAATGLEVELFAAEPMVTNPTNISVDAAGRVWVCEAYNYDVSPDQADKKGDRIIVLEDTDHDGKADKRTVFYQGTDLFLPLGITVLGDKIYVTCSPNVFAFTDANGDLIPENKEVLFTSMSKGEHSTHAMFPGPDGMIYFSVGNYMRNILDKDGKPLIDKAGFTISQTGDPYLGGMVLRCTPDGKNIEVLGHNFRNNYEPCVDSYGNVWQSDNDDDGNESCRINFVMYYGNYGFLDEMSGASWNTERLNVEKTIPEKHWHQSDPGVVPNVLITGAGSPAGMTFYEGDLLPPTYRNVPIHAEPYYNVVRAYLPAKRGAGYTLEIENILRSNDKWFRPIDVTTAPDGSLIIADWYDPILGGGAAADANKGRIYRVATTADEYKVPTPVINTIEHAIEALKNPNNETRYIGFQYLEKQGSTAMQALKKLWQSDNQVFRARALWLLAKLAGNDQFLREALADSNVDIKIAAVRAVAHNKQDIIPYLSLVAEDDSPAVRREVAIALRYTGMKEAADIWIKLADQYDGKDRWYLEALGIAADLHADLFFQKWVETIPLDLSKKTHQDIVCRSRSPKALPLLAALIKNTDDPSQHERYFRTFDFHQTPFKTEVLTSLVGLQRKDGKHISSLALQQMNGNDVKMSPRLRLALEDALQETAGTVAFVNLVEKFSLKDKQQALLELATTGKPAGPAATELLLKFGAHKILKLTLQKNDTSSLLLLRSMQGKGSREVVDMIGTIVENTDNSINLRKAAITTLGSSWPGEEKLLSLVKNTSFEDELKPAAAGILFNVYRSKIQREAGQYLVKPAAKGSDLPSIKELLATAGDGNKGKQTFSKYCKSCHRANDDGVKFGPELTQIGDKLSKEGLYRAILYPDEGVSYGYETTIVRLQEETESMGIVASETASEIVLNLPGGSIIKHARADVKQITKDGKSLMPALAGTMTRQELVDLVEYLSALKK